MFELNFDCCVFTAFGYCTFFLPPHSFKKLNQCYPRWNLTVREELFGAENQSGFIPQTSAFVGHAGNVPVISALGRIRRLINSRPVWTTLAISPAWATEQGRLSLKPCLKNSGEPKSVQQYSQFDILHKLLLCFLQTLERLVLLSPNTFQ